VPTDLLPALIGSCVRGTAILAFVWAITALMRRSAASTRHWLWTCAIAAAGLMPVVAVIVPRWHVPSPPALVSLSQLGTRDSALLPGPGTRDSGLDSRFARDSGLDRIPDSGSRVPYPGTVAAIVWAGGTLTILLYLLVGSTAAWWMRRRATPIDAPWVDDARAVAEALAVPKPIRVVESALTTTPLVCGFWRPVIVMPRGAAEWSEARLHTVTLHELAHIKRRDCVTQAVAQLVCALYWFNPLIWIAARRLRSERERACDDFVLAAGTRGSDYARHLLEIAQARQPARFSPLAAASLAMACPSQLEGRLMAILDPSLRRSSAFSIRLAAATLLAVISVPVAAVQLQTPAARSAADARAERNDRVRRALDVELYEAAEDGDLDGVSDLLAAGADVNAVIRGDGSPLIGASRRGRMAAVRLLLDRGADPNLPVSGDGSPLIVAAGGGHLPVVQLLLDRGADPNLGVEGDGNPIIMAARGGHIPVIELLLERGASIDQVVDGDENAVIQAAGAGQLATVKLLVSRGANVNTRVWVIAGWGTGGAVGGMWRTPLSMARLGGHDDVVQYLMSVGAQE
jgi:beta-lactamase regulating signal transducer with metallopeptidase domain/ankyrin repeat protein